jgi:AcrR family transcriptional regulator
VVTNYYWKENLMAGEQQAAKRTRMRGEERRESILLNAKHVFARSTYAEASTGELARESGVTEPMLYKHFGSKKGLFQSLLQRLCKQTLALLQERIERRAEKSVLEALEHVVDDYCAIIKTDPEGQRILFQAVAESGDTDIANSISSHNRAVYRVIHQLVERAQQEGYLDATINLDAAAWGYMSTILATQYSLMLNLSGEIARVRDEMSRIWLRGLCAHES